MSFNDVELEACFRQLRFGPQFANAVFVCENHGIIAFLNKNCCVISGNYDGSFKIIEVDPDQIVPYESVIPDADKKQSVEYFQQKNWSIIETFRSVCLGSSSSLRANMMVVCNSIILFLGVDSDAVNFYSHIRERDEFDRHTYFSVRRIDSETKKKLDND